MATKEYKRIIVCTYDNQQVLESVVQLYLPNAEFWFRFPWLLPVVLASHLQLAPYQLHWLVELRVIHSWFYHQMVWIEVKILNMKDVDSLFFVLRAESCGCDSETPQNTVRFFLTALSVLIMNLLCHGQTLLDMMKNIKNIC